MQNLEMLLFDILYLIMNCDYEVTEAEKSFLLEAIDDLDEENKKILKIRQIELDKVISQGFNSIEEKITENGKIINELKWNTDDLIGFKNSYLNVLKGLILIDKKIHKNEQILFDKLCELWGVNVKLSK